MTLRETKRLRRQALTGLVCCLGAMSVSQHAAAEEDGGWTVAGQNLQNTRFQCDEHTLSPDNVGGLQVGWSVTTGGDVSATPSVDDDYVYFPDRAGNLFKVERASGHVVWQRQISEYTGIAGDYSRNTPAIAGNLLIVGNQAGVQYGPGASVIAVNKHTGDKVWVTKVESHPSAIVTQSPTVFGNDVFVGVSSAEELHAVVRPSYECCSFRGSMLALNLRTGKIKWQTYMAPEGFSGSAIWGSSPSVDPKRRQVYIATGNNYSAPQEFLDCIEAAGDDADAQYACLEPYPGNYFDSVVALDMKSGAIRWATSVVPFDVFTIACIYGLPSCQSPESPDFDFGQAPMLYSVKKRGKKQDLVGVGQKSGVFWSLDADTGAVVWNTKVSPGGAAGGIMWGSAYDGRHIYTSSANSRHLEWDLFGGGTTTGGIWTALDPATGRVVWQTANPTGSTAGGAVSAANGVVYACSQDPVGHMYALDASSGAIAWDYESGGSCNSGAAIVEGKVFWGTGYAGFGPPNTSYNKFYAFELP